MDKTTGNRKPWNRPETVIRSMCFGILGILWVAAAATGCRTSLAVGDPRAAAADPDATVVLVRDGQARAVVVAPEDRGPLQRNGVDGVEELVEHIRMIGGVTLPVVTDANEVPDGMLPINLCRQADAALDEAIQAADGLDDAFALRVTADAIDIRGATGQGTLFGIYELLEQFGIRWYMPGELGRVMPRSTTVAARIQETVQVPSINARTYSGWTDRNTGWYIRQRMGSGGAHLQPGRHGMPGSPPRGDSGRQICVSGHYAPGALEAVVGALREQLENNPDMKGASMGPADGGGFCQCEGCRELDGDAWDPLRGAPSMTDRYIWFFNRILEELEDDHPDFQIGWYVYSSHFQPPEKFVPNPNIIATFAPIDLDRNRGMDNPMSPDRHIFRHVIDGWAEFEPKGMRYRGYYNALACPQFPWSQLDRVRNEIPALYEKGLQQFRVEIIRQSWASSPITPYVAARVMWDVNTDVDALLDDFYAKFFGPAEEPMRDYLEGLESAFRDTPYFTGSSYVYFPIFDTQRRDTLRGHLEAAAARAPRRDGCLYGERVWALQKGFERMEIFLDMIAARNRLDFQTAYAKMQEYYTLNDKLADYILEPSSDAREHLALVNAMERSDRRGNYFNRFFEPAVSSGYHRTVEAGDLVKALPDEWDFLIDPADIGEIAGYYRPGELGGNWQPLKTTSRSWSDQGLHYYKGTAWYRTRVTLPDDFEGRMIYLWIGAVDRVAHVWINGHYTGSSTEPEEGLPGAPGTFRPFDMPATRAVRHGEDNWVTVKIESRDRLAEIGTGGIIAPVMFWSPHDPDWRP